MKKVALGIILLSIMGFAANELITIPSFKAAPEATGFKFYYFPKLNMYYDVTQNNFVYTVDGGMTWQTKKPTQQQLPEKMNDKITFYSPDPDAWIYNTEHRKKYKGVATNYVQRREDTALFVPKPAIKKQDSVATIKKEKKENSTAKKEGSWFKRLKDKFKKGFKKAKDAELPDSLSL